MPTVIIAGTQNQPFGSFPSISKSQDGLTWSAPTAPFAARNFCTGVASNGILFLISSQCSQLSSTTDFLNFSPVTVNPGVGQTSLVHAGSSWVLTGVYNYIDGYGPYPPKTEVAQIYRSTYGNTGWQMVWTHENNNSYFFQTKFFHNAPITSSISANVCVVVGNNGYNTGDIWYSLDYGVSWTQADIPQNCPVIYSVTVYNLGGTPTWYFGCRGKIFLAKNLHDTNWNELPLDQGDTAVGFAHNSSGSLIVNGINTLYTSLSGAVFKKFTYPGYVWSDVAVLELTTGSRWLAFTRSNLTQHTYFYSDDLSKWTPLSNGISVQASTVV